jgi:5'-nucleotidase / UDP-sugar diphosphatase
MPHLSRRHFLATAATLPFSLRAQESNSVRRLTILHTNDIHARLSPSREGVGGLAYLASLLKRERALAPHHLYLDAGDFVQGTPVSSLYEGVPVYQLMNLLHPDAVAVGNHEFDYGWQRIYDYLSHAHYPLFCANLVNEQGLLFTPPAYLIREVNGVRIAIIALLTDRMPTLTYAHNLGPWKFLPLAETLRKYIAIARERDGAQMFVGLTHIFPDEERMLLEAVPEVHLIVSGHDHGGMREIVRDGNRMVVRTRPFTQELGRVDLAFDVDAGKVASIDWQRLPITVRDLEPDPTVDKEVQIWEQRVSSVVDQKIGECRTARNRFEMRDLIEEAVKQELRADFVFINRGAVRAGLPVGIIQAREIWDALPFGNRLVIGTIAGSQLPDTILRGASVQADRLYRVVTLDYVAANQREIEAEGLSFPERGPFVRELMIDWIRQKRVVD